MGKRPKAQVIEICQDGLSLFPMGSTLQSGIIADLLDIDTSTIYGQLEYGRISKVYHDNDDGPYIYKKLVNEKYAIAGMDIKNIYIGYNESEKVRLTAITLRNNDFSKVKNILDSVYGPPLFASYSEIGGASFQTYTWSSSGFDITFSGSTSMIDFCYPPPKEYFDRILNSID